METEDVRVSGHHVINADGSSPEGDEKMQEGVGANTQQESLPTVPLEEGASLRGRALSMRDVPYTVWQRARQNALASNLSFREYVIRVLETSGPFPSR